mmetsp:Transcript_5340/g.10064  ORF Transcript_5340/g.10064 Transcript_5340/m.10064 type:complete len:88 (-) Transcript_5340:49-312(-)
MGGTIPLKGESPTGGSGEQPAIVTSAVEAGTFVYAAASFSASASASAMAVAMAVETEAIVAAAAAADASTAFVASVFAGPWTATQAY